tara:strand:+ start:308 stop:766 length:459 start_codon:yes stop_codon:yes gene_type:complete
MRISTNISFREATHSNTAKRRGLRNAPSEVQLENMVALAENIFEPLRAWTGGAIKINSFFRSAKVNAAVGGSSRSQHCKGEAVDIDDVYGFKTNAEMFHYIKDNLPFDQMIWEFGDSHSPDWVHVSYKKNGDNRGKLLRAERIGGRTSYRNF